MRGGHLLKEIICLVDYNDCKTWNLINMKIAFSCQINRLQIFSLFKHSFLCLFFCSFSFSFLNRNTRSVDVERQKRVFIEYQILLMCNVRNKKRIFWGNWKSSIENVLIKERQEKHFLLCKFLWILQTYQKSSGVVHLLCYVENTIFWTPL